MFNTAYWCASQLPRSNVINYLTICVYYDDYVFCLLSCIGNSDNLNLMLASSQSWMIGCRIVSDKDLRVYLPFQKGQQTFLKGGELYGI